MREYELVLIINPELDETETDSLIESVKNNVESNGGEVLKVDPWGRKRLSFPIKRNSDGYYVLLIFNSEPAFVRELTNSFRVVESIFRHMIVQFEGDLDKVISLRDERESRAQKKPPPSEKKVEKGTPDGESEDDEDSISEDDGENQDGDEVSSDVSETSDES